MMKKLIIVCEEKLRKYGDFLSQLVSLEDDKDDQIIGVKDGSVAAQVWSEKEYVSNAAQISSEQYILFIGSSKMMKDKGSHMLRKFCEHGVEYRWLGKQATLFIKRGLNADQYEDFIEFARGIQPDTKKLIEKEDRKLKFLEDKAPAALPDDKKLLRVVKAAALPVAGRIVAGGEAVTMLKKNKEIEDQQYTCAVLYFYLNDLSKFMGI